MIRVGEEGQEEEELEGERNVWCGAIRMSYMYIAYYYLVYTYIIKRIYIRYVLYILPFF